MLVNRYKISELGIVSKLQGILWNREEENKYEKQKHSQGDLFYKLKREKEYREIYKLIKYINIKIK